jgi:hypothetical protein
MYLSGLSGKASRRSLKLAMQAVCAIVASSAYGQSVGASGDIRGYVQDPHDHVVIYPTVTVGEKNLSIGNFNNSVPLPPVGFTATVYFNFDFDIMLGPLNGTLLPYSGSGVGGMSFTGVSDVGGLKDWNTQMLQLDLVGGTLPSNVRIREAAQPPSLGHLTVNNGFLVNSFFDVFTELSLDGGQNWAPASEPIHLVGSVPEPASLCAFAIAGLGLIGRRRRRRL